VAFFILVPVRVYWACLGMYLDLYHYTPPAQYC